MVSGGEQSGHSGPDERVRHLAERAGRHAQSGEYAAALALYTELLGIDAGHPDAINFVSITALQAGDVRRSIALLEQGVAAHPTDAMLQKNLGLAYRAGGAKEAALATFNRAVQLKPDFVVAYLNRGALLMDLGRNDEAIGAYLQAFEAADSTGLFLNPASIPPGVRVMAEKGMALLRDARLAVFHAALAPVEREHG